MPENKSKNRYNNLAAYDATRVHLPLFPGDGDTKNDYINANYVDVSSFKWYLGVFLLEFLRRGTRGQRRTLQPKAQNLSQSTIFGG